MTINLSQPVCLVAANLLMPQATRGAVPDALCRLGDLCPSGVVQLAQTLQVPPAYFLNGSFLQAGVGNTQNNKIGKAAAHELAAQLGVCCRALEQSQQLVAAKEEIIDLLRGEYNRPN